MKSWAVQTIHFFLLGFLGFSATGISGALMISPSGKLLGGMPVSLLDKSPFHDFLIPSIILFVVTGLFPTFLIFASLKKPPSALTVRLNFCNDMHWVWSYSISVAFVLFIWIQVETIILQSVVGLQAFYMLYTILLIFVALLPQAIIIYKKIKCVSIN